MLIKITPENEFEKQRMNEGSEHAGVKEFFMFGNKKDKDGDLIDFHDWSGSYRYLEGGLYYFLTTVTEEKRVKAIKPPAMSFSAPDAPFMKHGQPNENDMKLIDVEGSTDKKGKVHKFKHDAPVDDENPSNND